MYPVGKCPFLKGMGPTEFLCLILKLLVSNLEKDNKEGWAKVKGSLVILSMRARENLVKGKLEKAKGKKNSISN
jgi:hypothetical protein